MSPEDDRMPLPGSPAEWIGQATLDWWDAWDAAWEALDAQGVTTGLSTRLWMRLGAHALAEGLVPCQTAMRLWIREWVDNGPGPTVTEASIARRLRLANEKAEGDQHGTK